MKIAIVTFYRIPNYGAMLQAYALKSYLENLGHEVVFVQHRRFVTIRRPLWRTLVSRFRGAVRIKLTSYVQYPITLFSAKWAQTAYCWTLEDVRMATQGCDAFIVGSDQIWNPVWWNKDDLEIAMLEFAPEGAPRISYAVSFGNKEWPMPENAERLSEGLRHLTRISVREQSAVDLVRALSGRTDAVCLLDPTLLHTADFYRKVISEAACCQTASGQKMSPYIFKYVLERDDVSVSESAFEVVKKHLGISDFKDYHQPVRGILAPICKFHGVSTMITVPQWLSYAHDSDFVFTDSFHGTVFAILFHKPFVSLLIRTEYELKGMNERILSILDILGLSDRAVYADEVEKWLPVVEKPIDWDDVERRLAMWREKTAEFFGLSGIMASGRNVSERTRS